MSSEPTLGSVRATGPYDLFVLGLSLFALGVLAFEAVPGLEPGTRAILEYADHAVCVLFLLDFFHQLRSAPDRLRYLRTWGWLDLLSSLPNISVLRIGRAGRMLRILRVLRGVRSARGLLSLAVRHRAQSTFLAASLVALILLFFGSIAILHVEGGPGANIRSPEDAVWWAASTMTTVGYGDFFPISSEGRMIGVLLMTVGVGLFATLSGLIASWFLRPQEQGSGELARLSAEIAELRALLLKKVEEREH